MTKMATIPIYDKNPLKISITMVTLKLDTQQKGLKPYKSYVNDVPRFSLTYFTRSILFI